MRALGLAARTTAYRVGRRAVACALAALPLVGAAQGDTAVVPTFDGGVDLEEAPAEEGLAGVEPYSVQTDSVDWSTPPREPDAYTPAAGLGRDVIGDSAWAQLVADRAYARVTPPPTDSSAVGEDSRGGAWDGDLLGGISLVAWGIVVALLLGIVGYLVYAARGRDRSLDARRRAFGVNDELLADRLDADLAGRDYRSAIRYRFGQVLQALRAARLLNWVPGKTNADYGAELPAPLRAGFDDLSGQFSYAYYAGADVAEDQYRRFARGAEAFAASLPQTATA